MLRFTLDTCCVIHAAQGQSLQPEVEELASLAQAGHVELWLTTAYQDDQDSAPLAKFAANLAWIRQRPILGMAPAPMVLGSSKLGRGALASEATASTHAVIQEILLPPDLRSGALDVDDPKLMTRWRKRIKDVQHLAAHWVHGHDVFVTSDDDDVVKRQDELMRRLGIVVADPGDAVRRVRHAAGV